MAKTQRNPKQVWPPFRGVFALQLTTRTKTKQNEFHIVGKCSTEKNFFFFNVGIGTRKKISKQQASIFSCVFLAPANRCLRRRKSRVAAAAAVVVADDGRVPLRRVEVPFLLPHDKDITS